MANSIKCLMIGQAGIGKTTFLDKFPNSCKQTASEESLKYGLSKENYLIETVNSKFEKVTVDIENCDISLETCLYDTDLIVNNKVIPSNQFINTCNYKIIILCFAMDDPSSFELIKSKWEIDLKRNKKKNHSYVLLGLKSDTQQTSQKAQESISSSKTETEPVDMKNTLKSRNSFKKQRSSSINSNSSTSKLQFKGQKRDILNSETEFGQPIPVNVFKKFAKSIGSASFIQNSSIAASQTNNSKNSKSSMNSYEKFLKNILNKESTIKKNKVQDIKENSPGESRIPKSLSAPLGLIVNRKSRKLDKELTSDQVYVQHENSSFVNTNNEENQTQTTVPVHVPVIKAGNDLVGTSTNISFKSKLARLAVGLGTYIVTCGSANSRKLAELKHARNQINSNDKSRKLIKKNKSWLLLASEISLNSLDNNNNDEVFSN